MTSINSYCNGEEAGWVGSRLWPDGFSFPEDLYDGKAFSELCLYRKGMQKLPYVMMPFCTTMEAEVFGAKALLTDGEMGPRIAEPCFPSLEEMEKALFGDGKATAEDLSYGSLQGSERRTPRMEGAITAIKHLKEQGEVVFWCGIGPVTLLTSLVDTMLVFRGMKKEPERVKTILRELGKQLVSHYGKLHEAGMDFLSYADPVADTSLFGPRVYKEIVGFSEMELLETLKEKYPKVGIHLCGRLSEDLIKEGFLLAEPCLVKEASESYGERILTAWKNSSIDGYFGRGCLKSEGKTSLNKKIWVLKTTR